ncbi:MAG: RNA-directed DNA polymerase [Armatimonadota bacterium]|nr:RNA-directed DNA polymerase [Armatimonadota bacterium]
MDERIAEVLETFTQSTGLTGETACLRFSHRMQAVYEEQLRCFERDDEARQFRERYGDYERRKVNPERIDDLADVAAELWQLFPTHFFKAQHAFLSSCLPSRRHALETTPLGCTTLHLLDVGAGIGTASMAVIDLLMSWQGACAEVGCAPPQMHVKVIPVEMNALKTPLLSDMLRDLEREQDTPFLRISLAEPICEEFPGEECSQAVSAALEDGGYHLLICMSNILTWVKAWHPSLRERLGGYWRRVKRFIGLPSGQGSWPEYMASTAQLLASLELDYKTVLLCETRAKELRGEISLLRNCLAEYLEKPVRSMQPQRSRTHFENPSGSFWRGEKQFHSVSYSHGQLSSRWPDFRDEPQFLAALSKEALRVAWARTRWLAWRQSLVDEVGIRLFEANLPWSLGRVRRQVLSRDVPNPDTAAGICYEVPKSPSDNRRMTHGRFDDAVAMVALLQAARQHIEPSSPRASFGNKLNPQVKDEYLYRYFLRQHRKFGNAVAGACIPDGYVTCADVWRYYDSIKLDALYERLEGLLGDNRRRALSAWKRYILTCASVRGVNPDTTQEVDDRGIPQGHPTSGALANIYLDELDEHMWSEGKWPERFFRYVDDMRAISRSDQRKEAAEEEIADVLRRPQFGLKLNDDKTACFPCSRLQNEYREDLDELNKRCHTLVRRTYRLPGNYVLAFRGDQWAFCREYSRLLSHVGVHSSPRHLVRKLQSELAWLAVLGRVLHPPLQLPPMPNTAEAAESWATEFEELNEEWVQERDDIGAELKQLAEKALQELRKAQDDEERKRTSRILRFAAFRLTVVQAEDCGALFADLLLEPWLVKPIYVAKGLALYDRHADLISGIQHSNETVAACCARSAGEHRVEEAREDLWRLATQGRHSLARSAAIAALLRFGNWDEQELEKTRDAIRNEHAPVPLSSLIVLGGAMELSDIDDLGRAAYLRSANQRVLDAWIYARHRAGENLLAGPDKPPPHYSDEYPDFEDSPDYYGLLY